MICVPFSVTVARGTFEPCERMLMLPVPAGTLNWTVSPTTLGAPKVCAGSDGVVTGAACAGSQAVVGAAGAPPVPPTTTFWGLGGVHEGDALEERHAPAPPAASDPPAAGGAAPHGEQNEP